MKKYSFILLFVALLGLSSGCVNQLKSDIASGTDLGTIKKYYVVRLPADKRGVEKLIADRLNLMGKQATFGEKSAMPADAEAIVTYQDKWMWDITMYMIQLDVQLRKPQSEIAVANGHAMHSSLVRKSPPEMVEEVLADIFKKR